MVVAYAMVAIGILILDDGCIQYLLPHNPGCQPEGWVAVVPAVQLRVAWLAELHTVGVRGAEAGCVSKPRGVSKGRVVPVTGAV